MKNLIFAAAMICAATPTFAATWTVTEVDKFPPPGAAFHKNARPTFAKNPCDGHHNTKVAVTIGTKPDGSPMLDYFNCH